MFLETNYLINVSQTSYFLSRIREEADGVVTAKRRKNMCVVAPFFFSIRGRIIDRSGLWRIFLYTIILSLQAGW